MRPVLLNQVRLADGHGIAEIELEALNATLDRAVAATGAKNAPALLGEIKRGRWSDARRRARDKRDLARRSHRPGSGGGIVVWTLGRESERSR